jgi:flavodoxin
MAMNVEVRYFSRSGHTKKVAEAIAEAAGVDARDCSVPLPGQVDLLFLGGALYWGGVDKQLKAFVAGFDPDNIRRIAVFGTSSIVEESTRELKKLLLEKGMGLLNRHFNCWGQFAALHSGHPNNKDLSDAAAFARATILQLQKDPDSISKELV